MSFVWLSEQAITSLDHNFLASDECLTVTFENEIGFFSFLVEMGTGTNTGKELNDRNGLQL